MPASFLLFHALLAAAPGARTPLPPDQADQVVALVSGFMKRESTVWDGLDALPGTRWAPLPPQSLNECLADGGCYTRVGQASAGGRTLNLMATGARTIVSNIYIRNMGAPIGGAAILAALTASGVNSELARCPLKGGAGVTSWYRLKGPGEPAVLAIQPARAGKNEGFVISGGPELPQLQPNQLAMYSEDCAPGATASAQKPVSATKPHIALADAVTTLLVPAAANGLSWADLTSLDTGITWDAAGPKKWDLTSRNDPNPQGLSGSVTWAGRNFSALASGTPQQVKVIYLEEMGMHPKGEHMLGVVYEHGIAVKLVRCGPVYTESTNNWYSLTSGKTRPAMIQQSIRYEGSRVQDAYVLRLDGTLPQRDARDRNPGVAGCR